MMSRFRHVSPSCRNNVGSASGQTFGIGIPPRNSRHMGLDKCGFWTELQLDTFIPLPTAAL